MDFDQMCARVQCHLQAWAAGDEAGARSLCTEDLVLELVGWPADRSAGREAAERLCGALATGFRPLDAPPACWQYLPDAVVLDQQVTGEGRGLGLGGAEGSQPLTFRVLRVFEFLGTLIHRETVWVDSGAIRQQLEGHDIARAFAPASPSVRSLNP
jgi:hypothetical protein